MVTENSWNYLMNSIFDGSNFEHRWNVDCNNKKGISKWTKAKYKEAIHQSSLRSLKIFKGIWNYHDDVDDRFEPLEPLDSWLWSFVMGVETGFFSVSVTATGVLDQSRLSRHNCCKYNIRKLYVHLISSKKK